MRRHKRKSGDAIRVLASGNTKLPRYSFDVCLMTTTIEENPTNAAATNANAYK
jgi:hypothetical protein